jgi:RNA recognition motif-containing protein
VKKIYVGNLSHQTTDDKLQAMFANYGAVRSVAIIRDRFSGESRGFGFIEMENDQEAEAAIAGANGQQLDGRRLTVNEARPKPEGAGGGRGGYGGGGGGGRGGYGGGRGGGGGGGRGW